MVKGEGRIEWEKSKQKNIFFFLGRKWTQKKVNTETKHMFLFLFSFLQLPGILANSEALFPLIWNSHWNLTKSVIVDQILREKDQNNKTPNNMITECSNGKEKLKPAACQFQLVVIKENFQDKKIPIQLLT